MVSALWKAASEGDLQNVLALLEASSSIDIEIKDHTGITPLIEAVKNGHVDVVRALLDRGADPTNGSSQALPEQYTTDPAILELLRYAQHKRSPAGMPANDGTYPTEASPNPEKGYYPPPDAYAYYPTLSPGAQIPGGPVYYSQPPPPPPNGEQQPQGGPPNLPPPEVARLIPCRYFPACRYGSSCIFAHPQAPYFQGPLPPPAQYPTPYDPMAPQPYAPNYYPVPPPSFPPPNPVAHMTPMSPPPSALLPPSHSPLGHARSGSEVVSPAQGHFSPAGHPPPLPYGAISPLAPAYPHPGQVPVPLSIPQLPPLHQQLPPPGNQSPNTLYNNNAPPPSFVRPDANQYPHPHPHTNVNSTGPYPDANGGPKSPALPPQPDAYLPNNGFREGNGHQRRGGVRRGSFGGRKPVCAFFPTGRCRNGDDCRFPHVMPDGPGSHHPPHFGARGGAPRPRGPANGIVNGFGTIEEKMASMAIKDDGSPHAQNGAEGSSRSHSTDPGRGRFTPGYKPNGVLNGARAADKRSNIRQRVPNPDEFPVLAGATTPPARSPGSWNGSANGHSAPTAAQVLQRPPPGRSDSLVETSTRGATPDSMSSAQSAQNGKESKLEPNIEPVGETVASQLPISFAAVTSPAPDVASQVSVSA